MSRRLFATLLLSLLSVGPLLAEPAALAEAELAGASRLTDKGLYRLRFHPPPTIDINRYQTWEIYLEDEAGAALGNAALKVGADMPEHGHGLLTEPRVTPGNAPGYYRMEGLRFHMPGYWEIRIQVVYADKSDMLVLPVELE